MLGIGLKTSFHVEGLSELLKALRALPVDLQDKELQKAANLGIDPILITARGNAARLGEGMKTHNSTGLLARSVMRSGGAKRKNDRASFVLVKRLSKRKIRAFKEATGLHSRYNRYDPYYWKFWEFGTSKLPAKKFIRNAWDLRKMDAMNITKTALRAGIERSARRVARIDRVRWGGMSGSARYR